MTPVFFTGGGIERLEDICTGGGDDLSIDGIAIFIDGRFVQDKEHVDVMCRDHHKVDIEFVFTQAKFKKKVSMGEFNNFCSGVKDFLSDKHHLPMNDKIKSALKLKEYVLDEDFMSCWKNSPTVRAFFVNTEKKDKIDHIEGFKEAFNDEIGELRIFREASIDLVDGAKLKGIIDSNENNFNVTFDIVGDISLTAVDDVSNSNIVLCYASEFLKILKAKDGSLRPNIFSDNVRDFQGKTSINKEISNTIVNDPKKFVLLNNGLTIVCEEMNLRNRTISVTNPQIVNGCQTSNVIYHADKLQNDLSEVPLVVKIIATSNNEITNQIVRGTNRQNIVYEEAFEGTREFHKELEAYFESIKFDGKTYYYERRARQFQHLSFIKPCQKTCFRTLIQSFVACFLKEPENAYSHESVLLKKYKNKIFKDTHSKQPYYTAAILCSVLEDKHNKRIIDARVYKTFKYHILMTLMLMLSDCKVNVEREKEIDKSCDNILEKLQNNPEACVHNAVCLFDKAKNEWVESGNSKDGIKDNAKFSKFLIDIIKEETGNASYVFPDINEKVPLTANIINIGLDRYGLYYGFIDYGPDNLFFHQNEAKFNNFDEDLIGKEVQFFLTENSRGDEIAVDVDLI